MPNLNSVILIGHMGKDAELSYTPSGMPVAKFTMATSENYKDKEGHWQKKTDWHNVEIWGKSAEYVGLFKKGTTVAVEGMVKYEQWETKEGEKKYMTKIKASRVQTLQKIERPEKSEGDDAKQTSMLDNGKYEVKSDASFTTDEIPF